MSHEASGNSDKVGSNTNLDGSIPCTKFLISFSSMRDSRRQIVRKACQLGSGEALARICSIATVILLGHRYGIVLLGVFALAQSMTQYLQPLIDFGLRHVGARLMAVNPEAGREIVKQVQRRRLLMTGIVLPFILIYAVSTKLPADMKVFLLMFATIGGLYAISLDWAAWGKEQLHLVGLAKAIVPASILVCLLLGTGTEHILWWLVLGNAIGYGLQGLVFWVWWKAYHSTKIAQDRVTVAISESLAWRRTSIMGLAWFGNLAFNTIDILMLGVMSNPEQVGLYSAAYRVLNQVLVTYYLLTNVLYPQLARQAIGDRTRMLRPRILLSLFAIGVAIAAVIAILRRPVMTILFGHQFLMACPLLLLLAWAIPFDFLTAYLLNAYIAWGMEKKTLQCTAVAAVSNIVLNLIWIPVYGATAAAVNTLISYLVLLISLTVAGRFAKELAPGAQPQPELAASVQ